MMEGTNEMSITDIADNISTALKEHIIFQHKSEADALTAWIILTYFIEQMDIFPSPKRAETKQPRFL